MNKMSQLSKAAVLLALLVTFIQGFSTAEVAEQEEQEITDTYDLSEYNSQEATHGTKSRRRQHRLRGIEYWDPELFSEIDRDYMDNLDSLEDIFDEDDFEIEQDAKKSIGRQKRSSGSLSRRFRLKCFKHVCSKAYNCNSLIHPSGRRFCRACRFSVCLHYGGLLKTQT